MNFTLTDCHVYEDGVYWFHNINLEPVETFLLHGHYTHFTPGPDRGSLSVDIV